LYPSCLGWDDVFELDVLVDIYRVVLSTDLKENSNFLVVENIFVDVDVDVEELNDILRTSVHT
jgi:hypothetical protein